MNAAILVLCESSSHSNHLSTVSKNEIRIKIKTIPCFQETLATPIHLLTSTPPGLIFKDRDYRHDDINAVILTIVLSLLKYVK